MDYDLLLKGGHVIDPVQGISRRMDVAFAAGKVAAIEPDIPSVSARSTVDVAGKYVTPGLIDCHAHFCTWDSSVTKGCNPDITHIPCGCTTVVDAGSLGSRDFSAIRQTVSGSKCNLFAFVNLSRLGIPSLSPPVELQDIRNADAVGAARAVSSNKDMALGIKIRLNCKGTAGNDVEALELAIQAAEDCQGSVMVHVGNSIITMLEILARLRPRDIISHCFSLESNCIVDSRLRILDAVWDARRRGILFDANCGSVHQSFRVARAALSQGFMPDCISTDLTGVNSHLVGDLLTVISGLMAVGMSLDDVVSRVTINPARIVCPHGDVKGLGTLRIGLATDAAVLEVLEGQFTYVDSQKQEAIGRHRIVCAMTVRNGQIIWKAGKP